MSEFANNLPLSQRRRFDEGRVSGDWRQVTAQCLHLLIGLLADRPASDWETPSLRPGWRVRDVVSDIIWRSSATGLDLAIERFRAVFRDPQTPDPDVTRVAAASPEHLLDQLRQIAADRSAGIGRRGISDLSTVVSGCLEIARALDRQVDLPAIATGAVCLARILSAPLPIRAAIVGRSLEATDAGWTVGHGVPVLAPAEEHVLFLFGRLGRLPRV